MCLNSMRYHFQSEKTFAFQQIKLIRRPTAILFHEFKIRLEKEMGNEKKKVLELIWFLTSDVVLETRVLVSRRLEDKNETLGLGLEHLKKKSCSFSRLLLVILDGSEQGTPWHFVRDNKSSLPFESHCLIEPSALHAHQHQLRGYLTTGAIC